jgi:allantoinase
VLPHEVQPASLSIQDGIIEDIGGYDVPPGCEKVVDVGDLVISPGIVDTHVHVNEPGRTEWEGFDTATRAAAAGGVTTIVDMPLNSVPATTTVAALEAKRSSARGRCHVDVGFWGGVVPGNAADLEPLVDAGVRGFKCFLVPSGVDEFPPVAEADLRQVMTVLARRGAPLLVHAESPAVIARSDRSAVPHCGSYQVYLATRPPEAEVEAVHLMIGLAREFRTSIHIVHVAAAAAADEIARARHEGVAVTAETCPHYLTFAAEEIPDGATEFKCAPPIRESRHRDALKSALYRGVLSLVATDHSPSPPAMKCSGDFLRAWGGIGSLELSLAAVWTSLDGLRDPRYGQVPNGALSFVPQQAEPPLARLAAWMSAAPAALARLTRKGRIAVGCDADFVVWDPDGTRTVEPLALHQRHKLTPYAGRTLRGVVHATFLRGRQIWDGTRLTCSGAGELL